MKKQLIIFTLFFLFSTPMYADKLLKNGFLNSKMSYAEDQNINDSSNKILDQLSIDISERDFSYLNRKHAIKTNKINSPSPIFPRIEE